MDDIPAVQQLAVHAIEYGTSAFPENLVFADGDPNSSLARFGWLCYAIRYGSDPWILIDTGFRDVQLARTYELSENVDPLTLLDARLGIRAADVGTIIVTHHHFDHAGNVHRFLPHAREVYMHVEVADMLRLPENAWDCAGAPDDPERRVCAPSSSPSTETADRSLPARLRKAGVLRTFEGRWSAPIPLGRDGHHLRIESVGGHAPGSCMVWLHAPGAGGDTPPLALLAGDEIYHPENLRQRRPTGVSVNATRSRAVLDYISATEAAGTPVFTFHDPDVVAGNGLGTQRVCCGA